MEPGAETTAEGLEAVRRERDALVKEKGELDRRVEELENQVTDLSLECGRLERRSPERDLAQLLEGLGVSRVEWDLTENAPDRVAALVRLRGKAISKQPVEQHTCSNCGQAFTEESLEGMVVLIGAPSVAAAICPRCSRGTQTVKIVLRRGRDGKFAYEQYAALEMTKKAFGGSA